jgi:hypothetical protein
MPGLPRSLKRARPPKAAAAFIAYRRKGHGPALRLA